jgi:predicted RNA-binding Zn-ribbon protein involved in translation (DUF1610 family)
VREATCPICKKEIRSDASERSFCELCGMGIEDPLTNPQYKADDGRIISFCCPNCLSIYLTRCKKVATED